MICVSSSISGWERLEGYECEYDEEHVWTDETCTYQVLVHADGKVSSNLTSRTRQNKFYVPWKGSSFPRKSGTSCPSGCQTFADGCTCTMNVQVRRAFSSMPSSSQVSSLRIGAVKPGVLCTSCSGAVKAYGDITDPETVLEYQGRFYKNKEVVVLVGDTFEFRNPPAFVTLDNPDEKDVHSEVESLLDHLVYHNNTAPFISKNLIQRFTTSNPSPEYVKAVADAFKTGSYAGRTYQGVSRFIHLFSLCVRFLSSILVEQTGVLEILRTLMLRILPGFRVVLRSLKIPNITEAKGRDTKKNRKNQNRTFEQSRNTTMPPRSMATLEQLWQQFCFILKRGARQVQPMEPWGSLWLRHGAVGGPSSFNLLFGGPSIWCEKDIGM